MGFCIITPTPRGEITTEIPIAVEHEGPDAVDAFVAADVSRQLAALAPEGDRRTRTPSAPATKIVGANPEE